MRRKMKGWQNTMGSSGFPAILKAPGLFLPVPKNGPFMIQRKGQTGIPFMKGLDKSLVLTQGYFLNPGFGFSQPHKGSAGNGLILTIHFNGIMGPGSPKIITPWTPIVIKGSPWIDQYRDPSQT